MKHKAVAQLTICILLISSFVGSSLGAPTYEDAQRAYDARVKTAKDQFDKEMGEKRRDPDELTDHYNAEVADALLAFAVSVSNMGKAALDAGDLSSNLLDRAAALFKTAIDFDQKLVGEQLKRQGRPQDRQPDPKRIELLKTDPATSFQDFCKNLIPAVNKTHAIFSQEYEVDLKKTDSLITPYLGTIVVKEAGGSFEHTWRITIACQNTQWVIKRIEEHEPQVLDKDWQDTPDFQRAKLLVIARKAIVNP